MWGKDCDIELSEQYSDWLDTITSFNINARYDNYKREFYDLCTQEYTETWINRIMELREWIKTMGILHFPVYIFLCTEVVGRVERF